MLDARSVVGLAGVVRRDDRQDPGVVRREEGGEEEMVMLKTDQERILRVTAISNR
jgi:hypothetical protein